MLSKLHIRNYALIDQLEIQFGHELSIITGETGAGKSIIIGALGLILGKRADSTTLKNKEEKCIIEGFFEIENYHLQSFFEEHDLDYENQTVIRREITTSGKSRAFINDTPVNLNQLQLLTEQLIDIHSQHETLFLNRPEFQINVIDSFAGITSLVSDYKEKYRSYKEVEKRLNDLREQENKSKLDQDYYQFQFDELNNAAVIAGELENNEAILEKLSHSEDIKTSLNSVSSIIQKEQGIVEMLKHSLQLLSKASSFDKKIKELENRVESLLIELQDISYEIENTNDNVSYDSEKIQVLSDRVNLINGLLQKHRKSTDKELIILRDELEQNLLGITSIDEQIENLEKKLNIKKSEVIKLGEKISQKRNEQIEKIEKKIQSILSSLAMPDAQLSIQMEKQVAPTINGFDKVGFNFKTNKGGEFKPINKIASGGELSRLMLAIKSIFADSRTLPTIIFDEIDSGVSGDVASKIGTIMKEMAFGMQVITISHLPQIAGKGLDHFKVFKDNTGDISTTMIKKLKQEERVEEIAKMLSGEKLTEAAIENAKALLN